VLQQQLMDFDGFAAPFTGITFLYI